MAADDNVGPTRTRYAADLIVSEHETTMRAVNCYRLVFITDCLFRDYAHSF